MTLSWDDVNTIVEHTTYKPGWWVTLVPGRERFDAAKPHLTSDYWLHVGAHVPNSRLIAPLGKVADVIEVGWSVPIRNFDRMDEEHLLAFIRHTILGLETHEMDEWFAHAGRRVMDPHTGQPEPAPLRSVPPKVDLHRVDL